MFRVGNIRIQSAAQFACQETDICARKEKAAARKILCMILYEMSDIDIFEPE